MSFDDEDAVFSVVVNDEEQYSIWPDYKEIPRGWRAVGKQGLKKECLAYIDAVWTDMRPLSLRRFMESEAAREGAASGADVTRQGGADVAREGGADVAREGGADVARQGGADVARQGGAT